MKKKPYFSLCTIKRTVKVEYSTVNMATGRQTKIRTAIETRACGIPLFSEPHTSTGVCRSCREGWEVKDNRFATPAEKERAMKLEKG